MLARFFRIGSRSAGCSLIIFSTFLCCLIIWEVSFSDRVRYDRNRKPFGEVVSSRGLLMISRAIESVFWSPSKVIFDRMVFERFRDIIE